MTSRNSVVLSDIAIFDLIRQGTDCAVDMTDVLGRNPQTVRRALQRLVKEEALLNGAFREGNKRYRLSPSMLRKRPLYRRFHKDLNKYIYSGLEELLPLAFTNTKAARAANYLPELAARLLMVGFKYHTLKEQQLDEEAFKSNIKPVQNELRQVRVEFDKHLDALRSLIELYEQINENKDFWDIVELHNHFNSQLDVKTGQLIPPVGSHTVIDTYNRYRMEQA